MKPETDEFHELLRSLGEALGFRATREVNNSVLSLRLDDALKPRSDLLWSRPLEERQTRALSSVLGAPTDKLQHLPIVGIEVEGSGPSTKTLTSDVINVLALGTRLGLLVVSDSPDNMYRRAVRIVRTMRRAFGDLGIVPIEAHSIAEFVGRDWNPALSDPPAILNCLPAGGESLPWSRELRDRLRGVGQQARYVVAEPYVPPILRMAWEHEVGGLLESGANPATGSMYMMRRWSDYYTGSQIDMAWLLPLPRALRQFLEALAELDPTLIRDGFVFPELYDHVAVVGFEFESASGKHAGGGLANLSAYTTIGVSVSPAAPGAAEIQRTLNRYQPTLGL